MKKIIFIVLLFGFLFSCGGPVTKTFVEEEKSKPLIFEDCNMTCIHRTVMKYYIAIMKNIQIDQKYDSKEENQIINSLKFKNINNCAVEAMISLDYKDNYIVINYHNIKGTYEQFGLEKCKKSIQSFQENFEKNITTFVNKYKTF